MIETRIVPALDAGLGDYFVGWAFNLAGLAASPIIFALFAA
jgi:hypothetical protein